MKADPKADAGAVPKSSPKKLIIMIAGVLRAFAAQGISHVQLVVDPITLASLDALAPVLEALDH